MKILSKINKEKCLKTLLEIGLFGLAFFIAFGLLCLCFGTHGFIPFNSEGKTMMMLDMRDQYIAYLRYYRSALLDGNSLLYSMSKVFGGDFMSIFTYYLASPFNLFVVGVAEADLPLFFFFTSIIKLSFGAANFYLLERAISGQKRPIFYLFAIGYGLMSYNIIYLSNFMYMDVLMVLPLVVLGILFSEKEKYHFVYPLALAYTLLTSWYLGAMVCIFAVLFFLARFIAMKAPFKQRLPFAIRFFIFSLLAGLSVAAIWLTAFLHFDGTKADVTYHWSSAMNPITIFFSGLLENNYPTQSVIAKNSGYLTMFVGIGTLVFAILYFVNSAYRKRERLCEGLILFFYFLGCVSSGLYTLLHGGRDPSWYPGRFTFVIGFLLCYFGFKEADKYKSTLKIGLILPLVALGVVLPIVLCQDNLTGLEGHTTYSLSIVSLLIYLAVYALLAFLVLGQELKLPKRKVIENATLAVITVIGCYSSYRGMDLVIERNLAYGSYPTVSFYEQDTALGKEVDKAKQAMASGVYRMEMNFNRPGGTNIINNNPMFYNYYGLNHYSSSEKKEVSNHMERLGFHVNPFYETYDGGSTEAINSFLGVRYLLDDGEGPSKVASFMRNKVASNPYKLKEVDGLDPSYALYENASVLPLGFLIDAQTGTFVSQGERRDGKESVYWYDHFEYQNKIFSTATGKVVDDQGKPKPIFKPIPVTYDIPSSITYTEDEHGLRRYTGPEGASFTITFILPEEAYEANLYFNMKDTPDDFTFTLDNSSYRVNDYFHNSIKGFADTKNHKHTLRIRFSKDVYNAQIRPELYYENTAVLLEYLNEINKGGALNLQEEKGLFTFALKGGFNYEGTNSDFLFTLPYEDKISIYLDGVKKPLLKRFDIFSGISLEGVENGYHSIEIRYDDDAFAKGFVVSIIGLSMLIPALVFAPAIERKINPYFRKKEENEEEAN